MNEIFRLKNSDGIIQTYFDVSRPRIGTFSKIPRVVIPIDGAGIY